MLAQWKKIYTSKNLSVVIIMDIVSEFQLDKNFWIIWLKTCICTALQIHSSKYDTKIEFIGTYYQWHFQMYLILVKYTSFVVFIHHSQNIRHHNELSEYKLYSGRCQKHWIESSFSICLILHTCYRWIIILTQKIIVSPLDLMFCINMNLIYR